MRPATFGPESMKDLQRLFFCIVLLLIVGLACKPPSSDTTRPSTERSDTLSASPSGRRQVAKQLQSAFAGHDEVSIYTKGDSDEILYVGFAGFTASDKARADDSIDRCKSKIKGYGFKRIEFGDGLQTFWSYSLNE
jgi:hypothetical protein